MGVYNTRDSAFTVKVDGKEHNDWTMSPAGEIQVRGLTPNVVFNIMIPPDFSGMSIWSSNYGVAASSTVNSDQSKIPAKFKPSKLKPLKHGVQKRGQWWNK